MSAFPTARFIQTTIYIVTSPVTTPSFLDFSAPAYSVAEHQIYYHHGKYSLVVKSWSCALLGQRGLFLFHMEAFCI